MIPRLDPFAAAPAPMKVWLEVSAKIAPTMESGGILQTAALAIGADGIEAIYVMRNPDKLGQPAVTH